MKHFVHRCKTVPAVVEVSCFGGDGGVREYHLLVRPVSYARAEIQLDWIAQAYCEALAAQDVRPGTALFRRVFCSDLINQAAALATSPITNRTAPDEFCAISWVNQPPGPPAKVALWAYHVCDPAAPLDKHLDGQTMTWNRNGLTHHWTTGIASPEGRTASAQTSDVLRDYEALLCARNMTLAQHVIRTWFFVDDIGPNYEGVVTARREFFHDRGLTPETHFIASTGVAGRGAEPGAKVTLDAHAISGIRSEQVRYLSAPDHLCPTHVYGVTFERATQISYRDRTHIFVSGTASIDSEGRTVHVGDIARQLDRALENVGALLHQAGAELADMGMLLAYVRDASDENTVRRQLKERCGDVPCEVVVAAICRPAWLVEVEGIATISASHPGLPAF